MNSYLRRIYFEMKHNQSVNFYVFIISLKAAFSLSILARLRSMLQFDFSRMFFERSSTMTCWIIFWTYFCVFAFVIFLSVVSLTQSTLRTNAKRTKSRTIGRLNSTEIGYPMQLSLLQCNWLQTQRYNTISTSERLNYVEINHSVLSQHHFYYSLGIVLFTQESTSKYLRYVSSVHIINRQWSFQLEIIGEQVALANSYLLLDPPPKSLSIGSRKASQDAPIVMWRVSPR